MTTRVILVLLVVALACAIGYGIHLRADYAQFAADAAADSTLASKRIESLKAELAKNTLELEDIKNHLQFMSANCGEIVFRWPHQDGRPGYYDTFPAPACTVIEEFGVMLYNPNNPEVKVRYYWNESSVASPEDDLN